MRLHSRYVNFELVLLTTHRCGCSWTLTAAELERVRDDEKHGRPNNFRCLHREENPFREMALTRMGQEEHFARVCNQGARI